MGMDESDCMVRGSTPVPESHNMVKGSEQGKEVSEVIGGCGVTMTKGGVSSVENQCLGDDGVVEVVKSGGGSSSSVLETKVLVPSENDGEVLVDSEMNGVSSWLNMRENDVSMVFSGDGAEKLDFVYASEKMDDMFASESGVAEAVVLGVDGLVGVTGEDGGKSEGEGKNEVCDRDVVTIASESRVVETAVLSVDGVLGVDGGKSGEEGKDEDCDGNIVMTIASESGVAETACLSLDGPVGVGGQDKRDGVKDEDCDGNNVTVASKSRMAETAVLSVDGSVAVGGEDGGDGEKGEEVVKDEDDDVVTINSESRVAKVSVLGADGSVGLGEEEGIDREKIEVGGKVEDCDRDVVTVSSEIRVAEAVVLSVDGSVGVGEENRKHGEKSEEYCDGDVVSIASESRVEEATVLSMDGSVGVGGDGVRDGKNDEGCDGDIVSIEVPISETSVNMDVDVEDLSDDGYFFAVGDFVWGRIEGHPWWPGRIYNPFDASHSALKLKQNNKLLVAYFGDASFAWCHPSQLKPFEDNFDKMVKQSRSITFVSAVQEAVNEVARLLYMKMSHPFVANKTDSESTLPLVKNSGIKEGVVVPEILLDVPIDPAELLSYLKQIGKTTNIVSILELGVLKAQLSTFYLSKGGYTLPKYVEPQPVSGVDDCPLDETVAVGHSISTVEAPIQGPFDELGHSPGLSGNALNPIRKQKSIAEIMGEDRDVHAENMEGDATDEMVTAIGSNGRKKRKGGEFGVVSKPVQKKKQLLLDSDGGLPCAENDGNGGKEESNIGALVQSKEKKADFDNENTSSESQKEADEGKSEERTGKGYLSRERKKSKYLSPPFTTPKGQREEIIDPEYFDVSGKVKVSQRKAGSAGLRSLPVYKGRFFDSTSYQTQEDGKKIIDPKKIQAPVEEVLSQVYYAAICPRIRREGDSLDQFVDFTYVLRSSLYCQGSLHEVYEEKQPGRKRKNPEGEDGLLKDFNLSDDHISSLKHNSGPKKKRKETAPGKKGSNENAPGAVLFASFYAGSTMPSRSDLISVYSKFGALNEEETNMFRTNYTARVSFLRTCDAENALNHSKNNDPFGPYVTFELQYPSDGSKSVQHGERSKHKPSPAATPSISLSQGNEASKLIFIQQKLQGLTMMIEASSDKSPDMIAKLECEMKALLDDVNKMVEASLF